MRLLKLELGRVLDDLKAMGIEFPGKYFEPGRALE